ncbi:hypothetical protein LDFHOB_09555 [Candidatus Electronema aureum]
MTFLFLFHLEVSFMATKHIMPIILKMKLKQSGIHLNPVRKKNSKRKYESFIGDGVKFIRKRIESAFSVITQRFPAHIHAVTSHGFELKVFLFILAYGIEKTML